MSWLTDTQLEQAINNVSDGRVKQAFRGVFSNDSLPSSVGPLPAFVIVNTDVSNLPGRHWKALFIDVNFMGEVFDSLATPLSNSVIQFMNQHARKWNMNRVMVQHPMSTQCGAYVLYFVTQRLKYNSLSELCHTFTSDWDKNERMVRALYHHVQ